MLRASQSPAFGAKPWHRLSKIGNYFSWRFDQRVGPFSCIAGMQNRSSSYLLNKIRWEAFLKSSSLSAEDDEMINS